MDAVNGAYGDKVRRSEERTRRAANALFAVIDNIRE